MLNTISWQQYLTTLTLLTIAWYSYVILRYYRNDLLKRFKPAAETAPLVAMSPVMGQIKTEHATLDAEELNFGSSESDDISEYSLPAGPTDELFSEAQILAQAFSDTPDKEEFLSLLQVLLSKYEPYQDEINLKVTRPLVEQLPFPIEEHEWPKF